MHETISAIMDSLEERLTKKKKLTPKQSLIRSSIWTVVFAVVFYYLYLPALNIRDLTLYIYLGVTAGFFLIMRLGSSGEYKSSMTAKDFGRFFWKNGRIFCVIFLTVLGAGLIGGAISNPLVAAHSYHELLTVEDGDFTTDVESINYSEIPALDAASASTLGSRALGELSDMVSQFEPEDTYTQINLDGTPVRVASLKYDDVVKWFTNQSSGLPGYVVVDMVNQTADVVRVDGGIRYSPSERLNRDLIRHLRFQYPTLMFDEPHLEVDEDGGVYWICPVVNKTIGIFGGTDVIGAVIMDATTGEGTLYAVADIPQWVDQVYSSDLLIQQYTYYGKYGSGFINSLLGQSGVTKTTDGSNFIAINDDVYMYTGITSVSSDESTIGFILCNMRTKETHYYPIAGATEQSAMNSAAGAVQHLSYTATFPLLLNISDQPTYFIALKDDANLVKMYAMVNVSQYTLVATGNSIQECEANYRTLLSENGVEVTASEEPEAENLETVTGTVDRISSLVIDGNTVYYIQLTDNNLIFEVSGAAYPHTAIAQPGDTITVVYTPSESGQICDVNSVQFLWD